MKSFTLSLALFFLLGTSYCMAQNHTVNGEIVAFKKYPLKNIKVTSKKTNVEVLSDADGKFSIVCNKNDQLSFYGGGFHSQRIKIKGEEYLFINLIVIQEEEAYKDVVKSEHMSKDELNYCVENLLDYNQNFDQLATIYDVVQYVYPQAKVVDPSIVEAAEPGDFGATGPQIILDSRGLNSINASLYALLVVDGIVINDISGVHPIEVKTLKVLMGNEAAHWGMRGGNGVVEITTNYE
ncbi:hypothetical protein [Seonamhaeicola maritimus]|uniref:TonB-dependent receptor plug domain-containing protein n=1 Tax=Seonamhaeicola maritimus TaxID=2591822 RepID=A0A5C7GI02_9FLAO|nr:hypothetical protein [Seonamhaeicola maritimus]TXG37049.1 hypothetical protein FUA22_10820 [Seonamhaeicola maritimus]